ncbi:MAG TPA: ATPase, T2SS/T4P/T4SS family [Syntrophorhabdaceae bacterium]|nr:ATPase, T2SS/T4P/T4SS family [Syntrophorhabdaceae bacterium]HQM81215.1 ATPase, T2SS/T4P/T4SS family [Syntrophorhabdaceae bacterium]
MTKKMKRDPSGVKLGEILLKERFIRQEQLDKAIEIQEASGGHLGEILVNRGIVREEDVAFALSLQLNIPFVSSKAGTLRPEEGQGLEILVSRQVALRNTVLPILRDKNTLTCAMFDPQDFMLIDELRKITRCEIVPVVATRSDILKAIEEFYGAIDLAKGGGPKLYGIDKLRQAASESDDDSLSIDSIIARAKAAPVVKLVDLMLWQAIDQRASDIHIEPFEGRISLRYRIDGKLYEIPPPPRHLYLPIVSRIKILSKLDISEKRLPQDGTYMVKLENRTIDMRISIIPTIYGEKVVMRILDRSGVVFDLDKMGFEPNDLAALQRAINSPYGLVFITGPTGSGKSTTLYAVLQEIKSSTKNIVTVEDPVEYRLDGINQVQVKPEIGLTFAAALRSFLRQDPDIMLVGEVRDLETAEICVRSALTGHLVMSTLHTNDAPSAVTRLIDIGVEPYLLAPTILIVIGQRLVRKLCPECKEAYTPTMKELGGAKLRAEMIYRAKGCQACGNTGYKGRTLIAEVMPISEDIKMMISRGASYQEMRNLAKDLGMSTLYESGLRKVEQGITSLEEVFSVTLGI